MTQAQVNKATRAIVAVGSFPSGLTPQTALTHDLLDVPPSEEPKLGQPGPKTMAADGTITVGAVPPPPQIFFQRIGAQAAKLRTIDATATEIWRLAVPPNTGYALSAEMLAQDAGNGDLLRLEAKITFKRLGAAPLQVGATTTTVNHRDAGAAAWTITPGVTANDVWVRVVGAAGRNIDWNLLAQVVRFTPGGFDAAF